MNSEEAALFYATLEALSEDNASVSLFDEAEPTTARCTVERSE